MQGGGSRLLAIQHALISSVFDVVVLSEFHNDAASIRFKDILFKNGFIHQVISGAIGNTNTVFIASKHPCEAVLYSEADENYTHNIITAKFAAFNIMGVYLPHKKKHQLLPYITKLVTFSEHPFIIVGDYNTGHNYKDQVGDSFWYQSELNALEATDYVDAFRYKNGDAKEYSWFSHQGSGYRYDHTYVHQTILPIIKRCYYLHDWRQNKWSDHSPMVLELGV
jgi:exodeoxyribonuclease III